MPSSLFAAGVARTLNIWQTGSLYTAVVRGKEQTCCIASPLRGCNFYRRWHARLLDLHAHYYALLKQVCAWFCMEPVANA